jgi:putative transposase
MVDMKPIYQANNEQQGYERLREFEEKWARNIF